MPEPIKYQSDGKPFKPGQLFDPTTFSAEQATGLINTPGQSLAQTNTPAQISAAQGLVSSSTPYRNDITDLGTDITTTLEGFGITKPEDSTFDDYMKDYEKENKARDAEIAKRRTEDVAGINTDYTNATEELKMSQEDALAKAEGRTRIGGFFTQLEQKDILNMQRQHRLELSALTSKKVDAIQAANRAYQDEDYKLAKELRDEAKNAEKEIYNRKKDFYNFIESAAQEKRTATKFVQEQAQSKVNTMLESIKNGTFDVSKLDPLQKEKLLKEAGFDFDIFEATKKLAAQGEVIGSPHIDTKTGAVQLLIKKQDGTYEYKKVGQVTPSSVGTEAEKSAELKKKKASALSIIQRGFVTGSDQGGYATEAGRKIHSDTYYKAMQMMADNYGMTPDEFKKAIPARSVLSKSEIDAHPDLVLDVTAAQAKDDLLNTE